MRSVERWWWALLVIPVVLVGGFAVWAESTPRPMPEAEAALETPAEKDGVLVTKQDWLIFHPANRDQELSTGLIFYPGGRIEPRSYAPTARDIAAEGHLVVLVPMPLNLAFFAPNRASNVIASFPEIKHWVIGGHSLGGAMAARFAYRHPSAVEGLLLWASYPARANDLSERDLLVTSVYGTRDGLATPDEITASHPLLPPEAVWVEIEGGNHAQFGWYGPQKRDNPATIIRTAQQREATAASTALLERVEQ